MASEPLVWDDIRCFLALARNPRLREAARTLNVDPTTLNRRIRRLGQATNATLFKRQEMLWYLTQSGEALLPFAEKTEATMIEMQEAKLSGPLSGLVRVAVSEPLNAWFLSDHIRSFSEAHPEVSVELISPSARFSLAKREVDIGILPQRPEIGPLTTRKLLDTVVRLYASRDYIDQNPPIRTISDLRAHRIIGIVTELLPSRESDFWRDIDPAIDPKIRTTGAHMQARAISAGAGLGMLPTYVAAGDPRLVPVLPDLIRIEQPFWLAIREDIRNNPRIEAFVEWLGDTAAAHRATFADPYSA